MTLCRLIVMRHGETQWNASARMQGHQDIPLNDRGVRQANAAAHAIAAMEPDVVVSSDLSRAWQTAEIVGQHIGLPVTTDRRLRETALGDWEGLARNDIRDRWPSEWRQWQHESPHISPPGGESRVAVASRAASVVDELGAETYETALVVAHGGLIVGLVGRMLRMPTANWVAFAGMGNCHWTVLERTDARWRLRVYNAGAREV